jgi:thiol-disulfide isomerase/thioredoxin
MSFSFLDEDNASMWKMTETRACTSQKNMERFEALNIIENFESSNITFTLYYANWCGYCVAVKPVFKEYIGDGTKKVNGKTVTVQMIEEKEMNSDSPKIQGFPTIILKKDDGSNITYSGSRTPEAWNSFLKENV